MGGLVGGLTKLKETTVIPKPNPNNKKNRKEEPMHKKKNGSAEKRKKEVRKKKPEGWFETTGSKRNDSIMKMGGLDPKLGRAKEWNRVSELRLKFEKEGREEERKDLTGEFRDVEVPAKTKSLKTRILDGFDEFGSKKFNLRGQIPKLGKSYAVSLGINF